MSRALSIRLLVLLASTGFSLLLAEAGLRLLWGGDLRSEADLRRRLERSKSAQPSAGRGFSLFGLVQASEHPDVVYELKPELDGVFRSQTIRTNQHGLRQDSTYPRAKPRGVFRIVGLGDSHMFGWGVAQGETYLELLEEGLNQRLREASQARTGANGLEAIERVEVLNCAVPGYNTTMEVATFEHKCAAFDPDVVVVHLVGNDFGLPHFLQRTADGPSRLSGSYLLALVKALMDRGSDEQESDADADSLLPHNIRHLPREERQEIRGRYADRSGPRGLSSAYKRLAELTDGKGGAPRVPVILLMLGTGGEVRQYALIEAERYGFEVLDAAPHFARRLEESGTGSSRDDWRAAYVLADDGHPTALAHRRYAEVLEQAVVGLSAWR